MIIPWRSRFQASVASFGISVISGYTARNCSGIRGIHLHRALRILVDAAEPVERRRASDALRRPDLFVVRTRQRNRQVDLALHQQPIRARHVDGLRKTGAQRIEHAEHEKRQQDRNEREHQPQLAAAEDWPRRSAASETSDAPQRVHDLEPHRRQRRPQAGDDAEHQHQRERRRGTCSCRSRRPGSSP